MSEIQKIPLDLIDDPSLAMRSNVRDSAIEDLADDMREVGLVEPIVVRKVGERYEIIAGHRRTLAARMLGWALIEAKVVDVDDAQALKMRFLENESRVDVDPFDQAIFYNQIMDKLGYSFAELAKTINRSETFVRDRVAILSFPIYLMKAVKDRAISLAAAHWLNKITDETTRFSYVGYAVSSGITANRAMQWQKNWELGNLPREPVKFEETNFATGEKNEIYKLPCIICGQEDVMGNFRLYEVHEECRRAIERHS